MNLVNRLLIATLVAALVTGCAVTVPKEMKLADPQHRKLVDNPGTNIDSIRLACAESMLNASPATKATNIDARILSQGDVVVSEVDAVLMNVGTFSQDVPVKYRCEYRNGKLVSSSWTRDLK